ncbi:hypothetical protein GCM10023194_02250 [Planotetraspora phitsanulokensis]|uniref:Uncharacterized protein n=1 Tax=Planotetraspora phitsanulokensis TaxID=575192 RepID=A0A8J3UDN9_9ACTN|nr:hypothetical protein [Planotetraspora phitsanulokensis]GII40499.1 hypothetical protein Pph01_55020 [Planotetraspora phitsanulokensis]
MPPPEVEELKSRALKIHKLADDVEKLADTVHTEAGKMEWSGPLTDRVRGEIRTWKTRCGNAAGLLREEADRLNSQARDMLKP